MCKNELPCRTTNDTLHIHVDDILLTELEVVYLAGVNHTCIVHILCHYSDEIEARESGRVGEKQEEGGGRRGGEGGTGTERGTGTGTGERGIAVHECGDMTCLRCCRGKRREREMKQEREMVKAGKMKT